MGIPVVIAASGGLPVVVAATGGLPMTIATNGFGIPVTQATNGFGLPVTGITFGPQPPAQPTLTLTSANTDTTPDFTLGGDLVVGDTVRFQYSTSSGFAGASELTNTIDAAEDTANLITFTTGALALGTWYFRARIERPVNGNSLWSNTVTDTIVAAAYTGPGDAVSGWLAWGGLRAFSAATRGQNAVRIVRASDSTQQNFVTLSDGSLDVASIATFLTATTGKIVTLFDQTGGGRDFTQTADANRPAYQASGVGGKPVMSFASSHWLQTTGAVSLSIPYTESIVFNHTSGAGTLAGDGANSAIFVNVAPDQAQLFTGGATPGATQTPGAYHALQGVFNGSAGSLYIDGTSTTGLDTGNTNGMTGILNIGSYGQFGSFQLLGKIAEFGVHPTLFTLPNKSDMNTNQHTYWGF